MARGQSRTLTIQIAGDATQLKRALGHSDKDLDRWGKKAAHVNASVGKSFGSMAKRAAGAGVAAVGAYASIAGAKKAIDVTESLAKTTLSLHKNLGLSVEQASRWAAVAKSRDVEGKALNQAFGTLAKGMGAANTEADKYRQKLEDLGSTQADQEKRQKLIAKGAGQQTEAFKKLGITQRDLKNGAFDSTLKNVADGLAKMAPGAERTALSMKLFGRGWQTIVPVLRGGSKAMDEQLALADKYGVTFKGKTIKSLEDLIAAQRESKFATMGMQVAFGTMLAPALTKAITASSTFVRQIRDGTGAGGRFAEKAREIWREAKPVVLWFGRAARAVGQFVAEHPGLVRLAASIVAVGVAVRTLRFVSAVTGFSALLKGGRAAAVGLRRIFASAGTTAGESAAANAAGGFGSQRAKITKGAGSIGRAAGRAFGTAFRIGAIIGLADIAVSVSRTLKSQLTKAGLWNPPGGRGSFWDNLIPTNLLPKVKKGEGLLGKLLGRAAGGVVPGSGRGDIVPAMLEPGEFIIRRQVVERFGPTFFAGLNGGMGARQGQGQVPGFTSGGIVSRANKMAGMGLPYLWGGGHGGSIKNGVDCSGAVSWALGVSPRVSGAFQSFGQAGPGSPNDTKIYANAKHVFAVFNGRGWGTSREHPGGGPGWLSYNHRPGFTVRHLNDSGAGGGIRGDSQETAEAGRQQLERNEDRIAALRGQLAGVPRGKAGASRRKSIQGSIRGLQESNRLLRRDISNAPSAAEVRDRRVAREERAGSRAVNRLVSRFGAGPEGFSRMEKLAGIAGRVIEDKDTAYGQLERRFGQSEEDLGTAAGKGARISELAALAVEKRKQLQRQKKRAGYLRQAISKLEGLLKAGRKQRDRSKGARRAKISERLKGYEDRLADLKAESRALGFQMRDTELDIGDLAKEAREVTGTPDTAAEESKSAAEEAARNAPTVVERVQDLLSLIDLRERAGLLSAGDANAQRQAVIAAGIQGKFGATTEREQLQLMGDLREAQEAGVAAVEDNTSALRDLQKSIDDQTAFARSVVATENASLVKSLADIVSGQIAGFGVAGRALMPGASGLRARY